MLSTTQISYLYLCLKGSLHLAKFAIPIIVQVLAQVIRKVEKSKIHIAKVKKTLKVSLESCFQSKDIFLNWFEKMIFFLNFQRKTACARIKIESMLIYINAPLLICQSKLNILSRAEESSVACKQSNQKSEKKIRQT